MSTPDRPLPIRHTVFLVVNGPLAMSPGKVAAQCFQAAQRMIRAAEDAGKAHELADWETRYTKTIVRIAKTPHLFARCVDELDGVAMIDEGRTEVDPGTATVFATFPISSDDPMPKILTHTKVPIWKDTAPSL